MKGSNIRDQVCRSPSCTLSSRERRVASARTILHAGEATQAGERSVRVPVVLRDEKGARSGLVITIQLDPLLEEPGD